MHTENTIVIEAPHDVIFRLAADISHWPRLLPHYRYVRILQEENEHTDRIVKMAARRSGIPVSWTSTQRLDPESGRILYTHIGGTMRGMEVVWRIQPQDHVGRCLVSIVHDLVHGRWWMSLAPVQFVVGVVFVHAIADKTLQGIKLAAEKLEREPETGWPEVSS